MTTKVSNGLDLVNQRIINVADPSSATDAANKQYVDNSLAGLAWKAPVRVATTTNGTLATAYANGQTVDGITLATGDRILLKDQTTGQDNGIYTVNASGAPTRATDMDSAAETKSATVYVASGTVNADKAFTQTADSVTLGTTPLVFVQVGGGTAYLAGNGLSLTGATFAVVASDGSLTVSAGGVRIADAAAGNGLTLTSGVLAVVGGTGITVAADLVSIDTSVVVRKYAANIGDGSATSITVTHNLGTTDVQVTLHEVSSGISWIPDITSRATNTVTLGFATAPASAFFRVVVQA